MLEETGQRPTKFELLLEAIIVTNCWHDGYEAVPIKTDVIEFISDLNGHGYKIVPIEKSS